MKEKTPKLPKNAVDNLLMDLDNQENNKYSHYYKNVAHLKYIDVYRVIDLFEITNPCIQHALKKLMAAGKRGAKNTTKDIQEAIDSLFRYQEMEKENEQA
jgi:oligoribonuclease (3'-5' exoribonuclease)